MIGQVDLIESPKTPDLSFDSATGSVFGTTVMSYVQVWSSGQLPYQQKYSGNTTPVTKLDGATANTSTKSALRTALVTNGSAAAHTLTQENLDMYHFAWRNMIVMGGTASANTYTFEGNLYRGMLIRHTGNAAYFNARKAEVQAAAGL